ncbi:Retrovirus-related Pol polyprotein from transposon opus [Hypsizygus marmoreus]|uniref:Retrovirus-related Pol polyprotein from transposon opus n=1 Tax=Hypsizygus marmoreus TaxID=39966 RepID=A0A369JPC8_HYPMA|nr:Retrovirus-related Pol polyprotein from transposon opus [Hypsizygus marmoreus]
MPFGLRNGPSIFQRIMQGILAPYLWIFCLVYIDDIIIYSKSYEEHIGHLDKVLEAIEKAGITLSPTKCHLFYSSILLLGHKVSRLGLSTHDEKVKAILELERPQKLAQLQAFLGMVVYFSNFIPYYASICAPLFGLLKKGQKWVWNAEHEFAFKSAKEALQKAPVLGHPIEGLPYRLYTDASDEAAGCVLQQVQPIKIGDLKGTRAYDRLKKAFDEGSPPPKLTSAVGGKLDTIPEVLGWSDSFEDTTIYVERVIAYWLRMFKGVEQRYSTTEREALAAKEGLVKFQPFIEGEKVTLITDHSALQWARTYENANRRLATWGAIFSAYAPNLEIVHRAGRVHSNVDPLSWLPRAPPFQTSPPEDNNPALRPNNDLAAAQESAHEDLPARRATFVAWDWEDCLEGTASVWVVTRSTLKRNKSTPVNESPVTTPSVTEDHAPNPPLHSESNTPPDDEHLNNLLIYM